MFTLGGTGGLTYLNMNFGIECWRSTENGTMKTLHPIQTQGFFYQVFYVFVLYKIDVYFDKQDV